MRKLILGLLGVGLLLVGTPAMAQKADPLALISSGAVIPYVGNGAIAKGSMSFLELASPVGDNSGGGNGGVGGTHMFFFSADCTRGPASVGVPLTTNDFIVQRVDNIDSNAVEGLIALGAVDGTGFALTPLSAPVHARMLWFNAVTNTMRVLEPIGIGAFEGPGIAHQVWNPLRTGATFVAPLEGLSAPVNGILNRTSLLLVCPDSNVAGAKGVFPNPNPAGAPFPLLVPPPQAHGTLNGIDVRVYGEDERFLRNGTTSCSCLTQISVTDISGAGDVFGSAREAPFGTYTEIEGHPTKTTISPAVCGALCAPGATVGCAVGQATVDGNANVVQADLTSCQSPGPPLQQFSVVKASVTQTIRHPFTGYRAIFTNNVFDTFGRLSNGSASALEGNSADGR